MEYKDYYKVMGVKKDASQDEIKRAYRKLARKYHPDVSKEPDALSKFKEVGEAYEILKDPEKRQKYDQYGQYWQQAGTGAGAGSNRPHSHQQQYAYDLGAKEFEDFINSIFGNRQQEQAHPRGPFYRQQQYTAAKGEDIQARMTISLEDSFMGREKTLQLQTPVLDNWGRETYQTRGIKVKIPKGIQEGQKIRLKEQGEQGNAQRPGDLYIEIHIEPHAYFHLDKKNVLLELPISPWEAALGATVLVPTLAGAVKLTIPKLSQSGKQMRLKGRGLPGATPGDQIVTLTIVIPKVENEQLTKLYEDMASSVNFNPREKLGLG
jgi:curved DNA-binding protein